MEPPATRNTLSQGPDAAQRSAEYFKKHQARAKYLTHVISLSKMVHSVYIVLEPKGQWLFAKAYKWNLLGLEDGDLYRGTNAEGSMCLGGEGKASGFNS